MKVPTVAAAAMRGLFSSPSVDCPVEYGVPVELGVPLVTSVSCDGQVLLGVGDWLVLTVVLVRSATLLNVDWLVCDDAEGKSAATEALDLEDITVATGAGICET